MPTPPSPYKTRHIAPLCLALSQSMTSILHPQWSPNDIWCGHSLGSIDFCKWSLLLLCISQITSTQGSLCWCCHACHVMSCHVMSWQYFAIAFKTSLQLFSCTYAICMLNRTTDSLLLDPAYIMVTLWHSWSPTNGELWSGGGGDILTSGIELSVVDMPVWWFDLWQRIEMASSFSIDQRKTNIQRKKSSASWWHLGRLSFFSMSNLMLQMFHF